MWVSPEGWIYIETNSVVAEFLSIIVPIFLLSFATQSRYFMVPFLNSKGTLSIETGSFVGLCYLLLCYLFYELKRSYLGIFCEVGLINLCSISELRKLSFF